MYIYFDVFHVDVFKCVSYECILSPSSCLRLISSCMDEAFRSLERSITLNNPLSLVTRAESDWKQSRIIFSCEKSLLYPAVLIAPLSLGGGIVLHSAAVTLRSLLPFLRRGCQRAEGQTDLRTETQCEPVGAAWSHGASIWCMMRFIKMYFDNCDRE